MIRVRVNLGIGQFSLALLVFIMCCSGSSALRKMLGEPSALQNIAEVGSECVARKQLAN